MPESARLGARLIAKLLPGLFDGHLVTTVPRLLIHTDERPGRADMVQIEVAHLVLSADMAFFIQDSVIPGAYIRVELLDAILPVNGEETTEFQAGGIVPLVGSLPAIQVSGFRGPLDLRADHPHGKEFLRPGRAGRDEQGCQ